MSDLNNEGVREGLKNLLATEGLEQRYWAERDRLQARLDAHPFGLDVILDRSPNAAIHDIVLIAHPGITQYSVNSMRLMLQRVMAHNSGNDWEQFRLRIVRVPIGDQKTSPDSEKHDLYFELIDSSGIYICGGCNDCSGEGSRGGRMLESMFNFIGAVHGVEVENVTLPLGKCEQIRQSLCSEYDEFMERRRRKTA